MQRRTMPIAVSRSRISMHSSPRIARQHDTAHRSRELEGHRSSLGIIWCPTTPRRESRQYRSLCMPLVLKWLRPKRDLKGRTWGHNVVTTRSKRRTSTVDRAPNRRHRPESTRRVECIALATRGGRNHFLNDPSSHLAGVLQQSIPAARPIRRGGCRRGRGRGGRGRGGRGRGRCRSG